MPPFETQVKSLLGSERFAGYQRAQDPNFREIFAFSQQNSLPPSAAVKVYESRQMPANRRMKFKKMGASPPGNAPRPWLS